MPFAVVTVNYRSPGLAIDCLRSLAEQVAANKGSRAIVVDNDSGDGSPALIAEAIRSEHWSSWASVVALPRNGGFSYGNNAAIEIAMESIPGLSCVVLINPDALAKPGAIGALVDFLDHHPSVGIVGAGIDNAEGLQEPSAHAFPSPLGELEGAARFSLLSSLLRPFVVTPPRQGDTRHCDWVSGSCMAIRREVLDKVGRFDEGFFLYFEEVDFCWRARSEGWSCWCLPWARIVHLEGASTGINRRGRRRSAYWFDSRRRFFVKHYGIAGLLAADALWVLGRCSLILRRGLGLGGGKGACDEPELFARDMIIGDIKALACGKVLRSSYGNTE
jgi:N-acetylglucosaminyl-diphospho-decaprenol L-rhamnosyltransferase